MRVSTPLVRQTREEPERFSSDRPSIRRSIARIARSDWFRCAIIVAITFVVHAPALSGQRIWDDQYLAHDNPFIKSPVLIPESFRHYLFLDSLSAHYRPIQNISYILDYFFWNTDEFGFHLTNVLLHASCGILLYFLLRHLCASFFFARLSIAARTRALGRYRWISRGAFVIAVLWVVHPVHSAAVDYISGRADSLAFFFAAAAWLLYFRARQAGARAIRTALFFAAAIAVLLALLSREIACIWIVLFIAHLIWIERRMPLRARVATIVCCVLLLGVYAGLRQLPGERATSPPQSGFTAPVRGALMARALGDYARLMIVPANLHMERTIVDPAEWRSNADWRQRVGTEYLSILGVGLLALFAIGVTRPGRGQRLRIFGAAWFVAGYLPISNLFQLNATVAEHWLYLPLVGFLIFIFGCALQLPFRLQRMATVLSAIAVLALSARSFVRSGDWSNEEIFYQRTLAAGGDSARVSVNLGQLYARRGDYARAEGILRQLLQTNPDYPTARINLGSVLLHQGKTAEAEALFHSLFNADARISKEYPRTWIAAVNLACVKHKAGDNANAFAVLGSARAAHPGIWDLIAYEAELRRETGDTTAALSLIKTFAQEHWWHYGAAVALGRLYAEMDDITDADAALSHASWLDVHDAEALHLIAAIKLRQNDLEQALYAQRRAIKRQPDQPSQYVLLSNILERMGRSDEARAALAEVSKLRAIAVSSPRQTL